MFARKYFVLAPSFHGATLLAKLLDSHPRVVCLGDTYPSNLYDQVCGCGARVSTCAFWQAVKSEVDAERYTNFPDLLSLHPHLLGEPVAKLVYDNLPASVLKLLAHTAAVKTFRSDYERFLEAIYARCKDRAPEVFVDGVKLSSRVKALVSAGAEVDGVLHLVRNAGDFARSLAKETGDSVGNTAKAAIIWRRRHRKAAKLKKALPYLRVDYESLCGDTDATLAKIFSFLQVAPITLEDLRGQPARPWHFMGNASLFKFDWHIEEKRHSLSGVNRALVEAIARPAKI